MYRTHTCGQLRMENVNESVCLSGWVQKVRKLGAMTFVDLRDRYGITQLVVEESAPEEIKANVARLGREFVILSLIHISFFSQNIVHHPTRNKNNNQNF